MVQFKLLPQATTSIHGKVSLCSPGSSRIPNTYLRGQMDHVHVLVLSLKVILRNTL